jgi:uncharacterized protein (TIGR00251 family)
LSAWARKITGGWLLAIHTQPGAKKNEVAGVHGDALKIRVAAPPVEGRANAALAAFIAKSLGVPRNSVTVVKGESSRRKTVLVASAGADPTQLLAGRS